MTYKICLHRPYISLKYAVYAAHTHRYPMCLVQDIANTALPYALAFAFWLYNLRRLSSIQQEDAPNSWVPTSDQEARPCEAPLSRL